MANLRQQLNVRISKKSYSKLKAQAKASRIPASTIAAEILEQALAQERRPAVRLPSVDGHDSPPQWVSMDDLQKLFAAHFYVLMRANHSLAEHAVEPEYDQKLKALANDRARALLKREAT